MKRLLIGLALFAFLVLNQAGEVSVVPNAVGFMIYGDKHVFFDNALNPIEIIDSADIVLAGYVPDDELFEDEGAKEVL